MQSKDKLKPMLFSNLKNYSVKQFGSDVVSGIIVAIIALPLSIALALASGVGPEEGLYTAIVAGFIISFLGGSRVQIAGPTAAFATIVAGIVATKGMEGLALATIFAGILLILMGVFRLGSLIKFIPYTITTGFTAGIAVTILVGQIKDFLGLTYPAGREIDQLAHKGKDIYDFPRAMIKEDNLEFSFSGLKSAFINLHHNAAQKGEALSNEDLSASFQAAVLDVLMAKTKKALEKFPVKTLVVAGGVAANQGLRERLADEITEAEVVIPPLRLCGDNAGMVSLAAAIEYDKGHFAGLDLNAKPSLAFDTLD